MRLRLRPGSLFLVRFSNRGQGEPASASPCTLIPLVRPSPAGCAAGVKFLLLHLPLGPPITFYLLSTPV